jgi:hypothetical protein
VFLVEEHRSGFRHILLTIRELLICVATPIECSRYTLLHAEAIDFFRGALADSQSSP